ncbi:MAG: EamA family transporter [Comamonadaceae bacterium CG_4_9_14_3_um_filter_60_33]|nr:MAG: EamA family transporter [Comamonadaceae bacterium CG_4_10_14_3_um_filter_60_42]PJB41267.1 MAG: EamA family transporter [Comamonadaceae bacterium CG_4_9_14_3_um_filter_60_33]
MSPSIARPSRFSPRTIGIAAAVITVLIWTSFILIARASADPARGGLLTPLDIAWCRIVGAALILLPWGVYLVHQDRARGITNASWLRLSPLSKRITVSVGFFGGLLYALLAYSGFAHAPALHASVLLPGSLPLWTALLAAWLLRDRITPGRALGLALIVLGDLLVGGLSLLRAFDGGSVWLGDLLFMSAALCWATYSVLARHHGLDAVRATIAITTFAAVTFVPMYSVLALTGVVQAHIFTAPLKELLFQALFQGWGSVVISGITFTQMIRYFGPVRSTMITAVVPGLSAIGAVLFLNEPLHWNLVAGLVLVTAGILFGVRAATLKTAEQAVLQRASA